MAKIIVSLTSYPARISNVGMSIYLLLNKQSVKPNDIYIWLAKAEFPNGVSDLPADLLSMAQLPQVHLMWVDKNTFTHKKHEIFKHTSKNDLVFLVDDDVCYSNDLIQRCLQAHDKFPNAIVGYNHYSQHIYNGYRILYNEPNIDWSIPRFDTRLCTQCMIPAYLYPQQALLSENLVKRDVLCPVCDETWLDPFRVYANIPILHLNYGWGVDISSNISHQNGLCKYTHLVDSNGYEKRDNWLKNVLLAFPEFLSVYKTKWKYGINN